MPRYEILRGSVRLDSATFLPGDIIELDYDHAKRFPDSMLKFIPLVVESVDVNEPKILVDVIEGGVPEEVIEPEVLEEVIESEVPAEPAQKKKGVK